MIEEPRGFDLGKYADGLDSANTLSELRDAVVDTVRSVIDTNGVCFVPCVPGMAFGEHGAFSHDEFSHDLMRERALAMAPATERFSGGLAALLAEGRQTVDMNALLGPRGLERSELFNEYWRPNRLERQLVALFGFGDQPLGVLGVSRSARQAAFRPSELARLHGIRSRIRNPLQRLIQAKQEQCGPLPLAIAAGLPEPSALFDARGQLLWASAAAEREFGLRRMEVGWSVPHNSPGVSEWRNAALQAIARGRAMAQSGDASVQRIEISPGVPVALITRRGRRDTIAERVFVATKEHRLTPRESEVLLRLASGLSNKEIANDLACSWRTVEVHVSNVLKKCGCTSRTELVAKL